MLNQLPLNINVYSCGLTLYKMPHMGNMRTLYYTDMLIRVLRSKGHIVRYIQNITDIDKKIITVIADSKEDLTTFNRRMRREWYHLRSIFQLLRPTYEPRVSMHMCVIYNFISDIIIRRPHQICYVEDGISFQSRPIAITYSGEYKPIPFYLWRNADLKYFTYKSLPGIPGWHCECAALIRHYFKSDCYNIHTGGCDLKYPHHYAEQQLLSIYNIRIHQWFHFGMLTIEGSKVSKSSTAENIWTNIATLDVDALKLFFCSSKYSHNQKYQPEVINKLNLYIKYIKTILPLTIYKSILHRIHNNLNLTLIYKYVYARLRKLYNTPYMEHIQKYNFIGMILVSINCLNPINA